MTDNKDYRLYLGEKFEGLHKLMNAQFVTVHDKLDSIESETKKTNSRVSHLEQEKGDIIRFIDKHPYECPNIIDIRKVDKSVKELEKKLEDAMFFVRHPKLFIGIVVFFVLVSLATFLTNRPLKIFQPLLYGIEIDKNKN